MKRAFIIYIASRQSTTCYAAGAMFVSRKYHNFLPRDDYNLSFVTCNHCHNVSLNYVYSQILIGESGRKCGSQIKFTHSGCYIAAREGPADNNGTKKLSIEICIWPCIYMHPNLIALFLCQNVSLVFSRV